MPFKRPTVRIQRRLSLDDNDLDDEPLDELDLGHLDDIFDAIGLCEEHDVPYDGLEDIDDFVERLRMHFTKKKHSVSRKKQVEISLLKACKDDNNRRTKLIAVMNDLLSILKTEGPEMNGYRRNSQLVEGLLRTEGTSENLERDCKTHMSNIEHGECLVLVSGETSAGKSSVLNLLFEEDLLPVHSNSSTSVITIIRYHKQRHARVVYKTHEPDFIFDLDRAGKEKLQAIAFMKSASERESHNVKEVHVYLNLPILQSGIVLVDTPGIGENEFLETELINFIGTHNIMGFMYIIKTDNAGGVQEDRLMSLLKIVLNKQRSMKAKKHMQFDPKCALFVCNRFDLVNKEEQEKVKRNAINKLSQCWPSFDESQIVFLSTNLALRDIRVDHRYINDKYAMFLEGLRDLVITANERRIKNSYTWIEGILKRVVYHLKTMVRRLHLTDQDLKEKSHAARQKLANLKHKSDEVIDELTSLVQTESKEMCVTLREYVKSAHCKMKVAFNWNEEDIPKVCSGLGDWSWVKGRIFEKFYDKLTTCIEEWDKEEKTIDDIEEQMAIRVKFDLQLLEGELAEIEREIQGDSSTSSDGISQLSKTRRKSSLPYSPRRARLYLAEQRLPVRLAGRVIQPLKNILSALKNSSKLNEYKKDPVSAAEEYAKELYNELLNEDDGPQTGLKPFVYYLSERPREYIAALERKVPHMILANQLLLNRFIDSIEEEREHQSEYEELMIQTESLRRALMEYGEGYIFVDDFSKGEIQIQNHTRDGDFASVPFKVTDFLRSSSDFLEHSRRRDVRGLWTVTYSGLLVRNGVDRPVAIRLYMPSSGVEFTFKEVAKLRCLTWHSTNLAEFIGIHNAECITPAFVYYGNLRSIRRHLTSFCVKRDLVPTFLEDTASGLEYLHSKGLVHMELTQDTITVDDEGTVQLTGACLPRCAKLPDDTESIETGQFAYLAPEVLRGEKYESSADVYSFGLLVLELAQVDVRNVFPKQLKMTLCDFIKNVNPEKMLNLEEVVEVFTIKTRALICNCLELDKNDRPEMEVVAEYASFIKEEKDALAKLPSRRSRAIIKRPSLSQSTKL